MKIRTTLVGLMEYQRTLDWPEGWAVPRVGESVELPGVDGPLAVRTVAWYPEGEDDAEPFVYVVIGRPRP